MPSWQTGRLMWAASPHSVSCVELGSRAEQHLLPVRSAHNSYRANVACWRPHTTPALKRSNLNWLTVQWRRPDHSKSLWRTTVHVGWVVQGVHSPLAQPVRGRIRYKNEQFDISNSTCSGPCHAPSPPPPPQKKNWGGDVAHSVSALC